MVKVRFAYPDRSASSLAQTVLINGERVEVPNPPDGGPGAITRAVPVRPGAAHWRVSATFFHTVPSKFGPITIVDATCKRALDQAARPDGVYLLQYDFYASERCTLACFRQWPQPDGSFRNAACEPAPTGS
jgi:hypothetical protein